MEYSIRTSLMFEFSSHRPKIKLKYSKNSQIIGFLGMVSDVQCLSVLHKIVTKISTRIQYSLNIYTLYCILVNSFPQIYQSTYYKVRLLIDQHFNKFIECNLLY